MPHKFFQQLFLHRRDIWRERIVGGDGALESFWNGMSQSEFVQRHPYLPKSSWCDTVPLGFHGDGGAFNAQDSLYSLSWNALTATGATMQTRFLFTSIRKSDMCEGSMDRVLHIFAWSMNVLLSGQTPHRDWDNRRLDGGGVDLAGGFCGCLTQIRGGWEWYCQIVGFPRWIEAARMCPFCQASATNPNIPWSDFSLGAAWRPTVWSHDEYIAHMLLHELVIPMLFRTNGGVLGLRLECVMVDVLHTVDLGLTTHIVGNVIWWLVVMCACFGGRTFADRISACGANLKQWYKDNGFKKPFAREDDARARARSWGVAPDEIQL